MIQFDVKLTGFSAYIEDTIQTCELRQFYHDLKALYDSLTGTASFKTLEHWLNIDVKAWELGGIRVSGSVASLVVGQIENELRFVLGPTDQTYLVEPLQHLKAVLDQFPD